MRLFSSRMGVIQQIRYALADLRRRPWTVLLNALALSVSVVCLLVAAFYGWAVYRYQKSVVDESLPTLAVAECPEVTDERLRFDGKRIGEIAAMPDVAMAFPKVELQVKVALSPQCKLMVPMEGTVPNDPAMSPSQLCWGRGVSDKDAHEVLMPQKLFQKLGGTVSPSEITPINALIEVSRTVDGQEQTTNVSVKVVGFIRHQPTDKLYLPLTLVERLDEWCANKIDRVPIAGGQVDLPELTYPFGYAYVPRNQQARVVDEAKQLQIRMEPLGDVTAVEAPTEVWAAIDGPKDNLAQVNAEHAGTGAAIETYSSRTLELEWQGRKLMIEALADNDPRWRGAPRGKPPALGQIIATPDVKKAVPGGLDVAQVVHADSLPGRGQFYCSLDTLTWLAFDVESWPAIGDFTIAQITDLPAARRAEARYSGHVLSRDSFCWGLYEIGEPMRFAATAVPTIGSDPAHTPVNPAAPPVLKGDILPKPGSMNAEPGVHLDGWRLDGDEGDGRSPLDKLVATMASIPRVHCATVSGGNAVISAADRSVKTVQVRFLAEPLFRHLAASTGKNRGTDNAIPCVHIAPQQRNDDQGYRIGEASLEIVARLAGMREEFWFSDSCLAQVCPSATTTAIALWHPWPFVPDLPGTALRLGLAVRPLQTGQPAQFVVYYPGSVRSCREFLGQAAQGLSLQTVRGISSSINVAGRTTNVICVPQDSENPDPSGRILLCDVPDRSDRGIISAGGGHVEGKLLRSDAVPLGMAVVDRQLFRRLAFDAAETAGEVPKGGQETLSIRTTDVMYSSLRDAFSRAGMTLRPLAALAEEPLIKYKVYDATRADGTVSRRLLSVVAMSKPTFHSALPHLSVTIAANGSDVPLEASSVRDVRRFEARVRYGRWLTDNPPHPEVILPLQTVAKMFPNQPPSASLGRTVTARIARSDRFNGSTFLDLPLRVVGLVESEDAFASFDFVTRLTLWAHDKVIYDEATSTFATPVEAYQRNGHVRCNVYATEPATVATVVAELENMGYRTEHHLAEQEGLKKLANVLAAIVAMFVFGSLMNAVITISITTMMNIRMKINEIGILRAHGVGAGQIINIFSLQGAVLGTMAFFLGGIIVLFGEPYLRDQITRTFKIPTDNALTGSIWSAETAWLLALACLVAVVFSVAAVILPAILVCRMSPARALQRGA